MKDSFAAAKDSHYEYVTPELVLYNACGYDTFALPFEDCGGNVERLEDDLLDYLTDYMETSTQPDIDVSAGLANAVGIAQQQAINSESPEIKLSHLIFGFTKLRDSYALYFMQKQRISMLELIGMLAEAESMYAEDDYRPMAADPMGEPSVDLKTYAPCMNDMLKDVNPLIGREEELARTIQILCRKDKNNPLHIGEPGVGKTAITYGLARLLNEGRVPEPLQGARIFALDLGSVLAGTQYRGEFEKRLKRILSVIEKEEKPIIYIDEIHNLQGLGSSSESSFDMANLLKPYLSAGHIRFIGATTFEEYKKHFEKNKSLVRR
ncbi:MAG: AAA family ATPase, partial [Firmicutes bacterium]|nr:AAA family ATPase [Bacillota bacterium]